MVIRLSFLSSFFYFIAMLHSFLHLLFSLITRNNRKTKIPKKHRKHKTPEKKVNQHFTLYLSSGCFAATLFRLSEYLMYNVSPMRCCCFFFNFCQTSTSISPAFRKGKPIKPCMIASSLFLLFQFFKPSTQSCVQKKRRKPTKSCMMYD